ncbi:MAG: alpha/beta hydrolase [Cellvibrionaceae bacterium]
MLRIIIRSGLLLCLSMAALFLTLGCTPSPDEAIENEASPTKNDITSLFSLGDCNKEDYPSGLARNLECGKYSVAENPGNSNGRKIHLNIARLPSISSRSESDPLFIFAGGPGQAATEVIPAVLPLIRKINQKRDIVFIDQRGTGKSNPLDCEPEDEMDYDLSYEESMELQSQMLKECLKSYDADLSFYTTPYAMDDVNDVRKALGYEKINVWGASYGTRAALVYMRRHPETVRTAVLDGVAPIGMNIPQYFLSDADEALARLLNHCVNNDACHKEFGDLESITKNLIKRLDENPEKISIRHPSTQKDIEVFLNGEILASYLRLALYSREMSSVVPWMISAMDKKDYRALSVLLASSENSMGGMSVGMQYTILCAEDVSQVSNEDSIQVASYKDSSESLLQLNLIEPMEDVCQFWPKGKLPENYLSPVESDLPTLIVSGELDPVTPPYWGDKAAETLSNSQHIVVPGTHHGGSFSGCVPDIINDFINSASLEAVDDSCVEKIKPLAPFISAAGPEMQFDNIGSEEKKDRDSGQEFEPPALNVNPGGKKR